MGDDGKPQEGETRRTYLIRSGAVLSGGILAGCTGPSSGASDGTGSTPTTDGTGSTSTTDGTVSTPTTTATATEPASPPYDLAVSHDLADWDRYDTNWEAPAAAPESAEYSVDVLAENLEVPWDIAVAPNGDFFITERTGRVLRFESGDVETVVDPDSVIDAEAIEPGSDESSWLIEGGEGGLLGIAVHPTYPDPPIVYTYATTDTPDGEVNRVTAYDVSADDPSEASWVIVDGIPAHNYHNGGRITFGPANYLWITTGDADPGRENTEEISDPGTLRGKVLRVRPDGTAPADNPDIGDDADPRVFTYGHRNPQGISWLPDGTPVIAEHGPSGGDEINVLRGGTDYGWPHVRSSDGFDDYAGTDFQPPAADGSEWAPSGCVFYTGDDVPRLRNRLLVGGLISQRLIVVTLTRSADHPALDRGQRHDADWLDEEYHATSVEVLADELGRIRHVEEGPDGRLFAITSNRDGRARGRFPTDRDDVLVRID